MNQIIPNFNWLWKGKEDLVYSDKTSVEVSINDIRKD